MHDVHKKENWGPGPWTSEPDRLEWEHAGFPCLARRTSIGNWCGYVALPPGHPCFEKGYDDIDVDVHGGLTYAEHCQGEICHVPKAGQPDNVWWLGFDCAHGGDLIPSTKAYFSEASDFQIWAGTYKDLEYVKKETNDLAEQLAQITIAP